MEVPEPQPTSPKRQVWNAGRAVGAKRALKPKQIWEIRFYLNQRRYLRDRALFDLAIDSKLRGCDLVQMKIGDIVSGGHLSTRQYDRLVDEWVTGVGLMPSEYGTHSLRRTKASIIYRATGNLRAVQIFARP